MVGRKCGDIKNFIPNLSVNDSGMIIQENRNLLADESFKNRVSALEKQLIEKNVVTDFPVH